MYQYYHYILSVRMHDYCGTLYVCLGHNERKDSPEAEAEVTLLYITSIQLAANLTKISYYCIHASQLLDALSKYI